MLFKYKYASPLGSITLASDGENLTGLWFEGQKYYPESIENAEENKTLPVFLHTAKWLDIYFSGKEPDFTPPIKIEASDFRRAVYDILLSVPYGQTVSYGRIADMIAERRNASRMSAQAVGAAAGRNPVSIIIPCHRVVGSDGKLTGYAGGIARKIELLRIENSFIKGD